MTFLLALLLAAGTSLRPGIYVKDEGVAKGQATTVNCTGAGVTCSVANGAWTLNGSGGGGGSGLPSDPTACSYGYFVTDQDINGTLTCAVPPAQDWSVITNKPTGTANGVAYFNTTTTIASTDAPNVNDVLTTNGFGNPYWGKIDPSLVFSTAVTPAQGGIGTGGTRNRGGVAVWNTTTPPTDLFSIAGVTNTHYVLHSGGTNQLPVWSAITAADLTTTGTANSTTFLRGDMTWNAPTAAIPDATDTVTGGVRLTGQLGGTATSPTVTGITGSIVGLANLTATGTQNSTTFLRGDNTFAVPPGTYSLPNATNAALGGVIAPDCSAGSHYSSITAGTLQCSADSGGGGAPTTAQYWTGAADGTLSAEKDLSGWTGIVKNTTGTPSAAVANDLPGGPYLTSVPDAAAGTKGVVQLAGQLGGTAASPTVTGVTCTGCIGATQVASLDAGDTTTGTFAAAQVPAATSSAKGGVIVPAADCNTAATSKVLYTASTNTFSCGTDQTSGGGGPTVYKITAEDITMSSTTAQTILSWSIGTNSIQGFTCLIWALGTATGGPRFNVNGPTNDIVTIRYERGSSATAQVITTSAVFQTTANTASCTTTCPTAILPTRISGHVITSTGSGTIEVQIRTSTAGQNVMAYRGSFCEVI